MEFANYSIMHPTDFSALSGTAFLHALKISLLLKARLYVLHVAEGDDADPWHSFPHVRQTLAGWGLFDANEPPSALTEKLGIEVLKVEIEPHDPVIGFSHFFLQHRTDLIVMATHGRDGLPRWIKPSIAEAMSRLTPTPTLFISAHGPGFVDPATGSIKLKRILVPVDHAPPAVAALRMVHAFRRMLAAETAQIDLLHVGAKAPALESEGGSPPAIELRSGNVVEAILDAGTDADLIAMATAGHQGMLDALRGSTTEQVLHKAHCPILAVPVPRTAQAPRPDNKEQTVHRDP